jgi:2'-5' RNA ligase
MATVRSFIAVNLTDEVRASLARVEEELRRTGANVRWVASQNFHLTLVFLGYVDQDKLGEIAAAIRTAVAGIKPFDIEFVGVGGLPSPSRPRVVYVGVKDEQGGLTKLNAKISAAMKAFDVKIEDRKYVPHMTLGRVASPQNMPALIEAFKKLANRDCGILHVASVELMLSDLSPSGPVYTVAAKVELV